MLQRLTGLNILFIVITLIPSLLATNDNAVLSKLCEIYSNATTTVRTLELGSTCIIYFHLANQPYSRMVGMCEQVMKPADAQCELPQWSIANITDLINKKFLSMRDVFFLGLVRPNCGDDWFWDSYNNVLEPASLKLPAQNCKESAGAYMEGNLIAVDPNAFNVTSFLCQCGIPYSTGNSTDSKNTNSPNTASSNPKGKRASTTSAVWLPQLIFLESLIVRLLYG